MSEWVSELSEWVNEWMNESIESRDKISEETHHQTIDICANFNCLDAIQSNRKFRFLKRPI